MNPVQLSKPDPWLLPGESSGKQPGIPCPGSILPPAFITVIPFIPMIQKLRASLCCQIIHICEITVLDTRLHVGCEQHLTRLCPGCFQLVCMGCSGSRVLGCSCSILPDSIPISSAPGPPAPPTHKGFVVK